MAGSTSCPLLTPADDRCGKEVISVTLGSTNLTYVLKPSVSFIYVSNLVQYHDQLLASDSTGGPQTNA